MMGEKGVSASTVLIALVALSVAEQSHETCHSTKRSNKAALHLAPRLSSELTCS